MNRTMGMLLLAAAVVFASGCARKEAPPSTEGTITAGSGPSFDPAGGTAAITGRVVVEGQIPPVAKRMTSDPYCAVTHKEPVDPDEVLVSNGRVQNVFVYVKQGLEEYTFRPPSDAVTLTQEGCRFSPHVAGIMVGQKLAIVNNDPTLHNIRCVAANNPQFNLLVLVVECDVPWIPQQGGPGAQAKVIHIGPDPLYARYPLRGFRTDIALAGLTAPTLAQLTARALAHAPLATKLKSRFEAGAQQFAAARAKQRGAPPAMGAKYATACVNRLLDADTIVVNEYPLVLEEMVVRESCRYYASAPAGGLGWGLGAALGAKLAAPEKTVICCVGDGAYMFGNPTASHFVSEAMKLPVLFVVFNNARWAAVHRSTLAMYPRGVAAGMQAPPFATLEPSPRFEKAIEASGGYGVRVDKAQEVMPALERALRVVKEEKRQALVNLRLEASYVKTS